MAYVGHGTLNANGQTDAIVVDGWATLSVHAETPGGGTWQWQFQGPDGEWRSIIAGSDYETSLNSTTSNMVNVWFGSNVSVRGSLSGGTSPVWDWQIMSDGSNR